MLQDFQECYDFMDAQFDRVNGYDFYKELFPENECSMELHSDYSHPNAVYLYQEEAAGEKRMRRRIMYSDQWEQDYTDFIERNPLTLCSGLVYRGRSNKLEHAQRMNALVFDLDGVGIKELRNLFLRLGGPPERVRRLPMPTFIALSGTGLHLYYFFRKPIDLYPNIKIQLKSLKYDLTFRMWEYGATSKVKSVQYQSINQSFRMVGSINEKHGNEIVAFRTGDAVTLEYVNAYAKEGNRVDVTRPFRPSKITREEARELYPEWYERVIVRGVKHPQKWDIAGKVHGDDPYALYHWWLGKDRIELIKGGHRYFYMMCLAIYAYKCDVPKAQLKKDMKSVFDDLQMVQHENILTEADFKSALEAYDREYYNFTLDDIEALTDIKIERNKRNGLKQSQHLYLARERKKQLKEMGIPLKGKEGRKKGTHTREQEVVRWRMDNPSGSVADCRKDTGLDPKTIRKWWGAIDLVENNRET